MPQFEPKRLKNLSILKSFQKEKKKRTSRKQFFKFNVMAQVYSLKAQEAKARELGQPGLHN